MAPGLPAWRPRWGWTRRRPRPSWPRLTWSTATPARRAHPGMTATLFDQAEAVEAAGQAFGGPLDRPNPQEITP
jgi:hypothetical protein